MILLFTFFSFLPVLLNYFISSCTESVLHNYFSGFWPYLSYVMLIFVGYNVVFWHIVKSFFLCFLYLYAL